MTSSSPLSQQGRNVPSELAITIATFPRYSYTATRGGYVTADEVRGNLKLLGFNSSTQQVAAALARMARTDAPWVERIRPYGDPNLPWEYRVTNWGRNDIENRLPGFWWAKDRARDEMRRNMEHSHA